MADVIVESEHQISGKKVASASVSSVAVAGTDRALYAFISGVTKNSGDGKYATAVTFKASGGDQAFTKIGEFQNVQGTVAVWYLENPDLETANVDITWVDSNATWEHYAVGIQVLSNVSVGATPHATWQTPSTGNSTSAAHTINTDAAAYCVDIVTVDGGPSLTENGVGVQIWNLSGSGNGIAGSADLQATGTTAAMAWTLGSAFPWIHGGISINPVGGVGFTGQGTLGNVTVTGLIASIIHGQAALQGTIGNLSVTGFAGSVDLGGPGFPYHVVRQRRRGFKTIITM